MRKVIFIDRDGTINTEPEDEQVDSFDKLEFLPGVFSNLKKIVDELDFNLVMVTNQDGLGTDSFPEDSFWPVHNFILKALENEGIQFSEILIDRTFPHENAQTRKPCTGMLEKYIDGDYDLADSFVIGDRLTDVELANNLGCKSIFISKKKNTKADFTANNWNEIYNFLRFPDRIAIINRKTNETDIKLTVNLDGIGKSRIKSGLGFLDHMLELFAKHSSCDITAKIKGDLQVDEHHTVEDTAIVLGEAISQALGDKRGFERYGFLLPMDEAIAEAAIDFSGRSWLQWKVKFQREKIGDMPTELFYHFFKSFTDSAKCNLYVKAKGENEHHKIEAVFKAVARSIKMAVKRDASDSNIPSTKGVL